MKNIQINAYNPSDAVIRAEWTGETVEQAQSAIDAETRVSAGKGSIEDILASVRRNLDLADKRSEPQS